MNSKWTLVISAVAVGAAIMLSLPDRDESSTAKNLDASQNRSADTTDSSAMNRTLPAVRSAPAAPKVKQAGSRDEARSASNQQSDMEQTAETGMQATPDAFPVTSMFSADQLGESERTDEAQLEAERNAIDLYFPVEEQTTYELSQTEEETQRVEMEQQIAEQARVQEDRRLSLSETDFDMPPEEH